MIHRILSIPISLFAIKCTQFGVKMIGQKVDNHAFKNIRVSISRVTLLINPRANDCHVLKGRIMRVTTQTTLTEQHPSLIPNFN